jgi:hypothetical protein
MLDISGAKRQQPTHVVHARRLPLFNPRNVYVYVLPICNILIEMSQLEYAS